MRFLDDFVLSQSLIFVAAVIFVLLVVAEYSGGKLRGFLLRKTNLEKTEAAGIDYILKSVFALLGLLIAFTFGLALDRYETRRDLVVREANAIGTAHIRAEFAQEPTRSKLKNLLETYAINRLKYGNASFGEKREVVQLSTSMRSQLAALGVVAS